MEGIGTGTICLYAGLAVSGLLVFMMGITNLLGAVRYLRSDRHEPATGASMGAWVLSVVSMGLGPCGLVTVIIAYVMARAERAKVMEGTVSSWSIVPCSMASSNVMFFFVIYLLLGVSGLTFALL